MRKYKRQIFNELRNNFSKEEIKKIRRKFYFAESIDEYLKEHEQKDSLTKQEKQEGKTLYQELKKGWRVFEKVKRRFNQIRKVSIQW